MTPPSSTRTLRVLAGFDGSPAAVTAVEVAARLVPGARATVLHLWQPPFTSPELRQRLAGQAATGEDLAESMEREGQAEADRVVRRGVTLARAAGWQADPLVQRSYGGDGYQFARLAEQHGADLTVVGSRGLSGVQALLGSVSDTVVHVSRIPVLVVPSPLTTETTAAVAAGPVLVGTDGSPAAARAAATAAELFPGRELVQARLAAPGEVESADPEVVTLPPDGHSAGARDVAKVLAGYASELGAAAVVVGSRGRSAGRELLLGSVAKALLHHGHGPVLVVPAPRA